MDLSHRLAVSYYKTITTINEPHHIYLVQHTETKKLYIKKILDVYNIAVCEYLYKNPIMGIPRIIEYLEEDNRLILIEEYISGCSLQDMIDDGKLSLTDIAICWSCAIFWKSSMHILPPSYTEISNRPISSSQITTKQFYLILMLPNITPSRKKIRYCLVHRAMQPRSNTALAHPLPKQTFILWAFS